MAKKEKKYKDVMVQEKPRLDVNITSSACTFTSEVFFTGEKPKITKAEYKKAKKIVKRYKKNKKKKK